MSTPEKPGNGRRPTVTMDRPLSAPTGEDAGLIEELSSLTEDMIHAQPGAIEALAHRAAARLATLSMGAGGLEGTRRPTPTPEASAEDYYPSYEALSDLVHLQSEHDALNGGGPDWQARWDAALRRAEDIVRIEP